MAEAIRWLLARGLIHHIATLLASPHGRGGSAIWVSSGERRARQTQHLINRYCGWIDQTVGTVATPANCVTCAPFINHTPTLPFALGAPALPYGRGREESAITLDQVERLA